MKEVPDKIHFAQMEKDAQPTTKDTKPAAKETKPAAKDAKQAATKPSAQDV